MAGKRRDASISLDASVMPENLVCCAYTSPYDKVLINNVKN
jgi:hypothetical protein